MCNASNHPPGCTCGFGDGFHAGGYNDEFWHEQVHPAYAHYGSNCSWNPTSCPICGNDVYFVRHNGGAVWLDELGNPWPKHPCFDDEHIAQSDSLSLRSYQSEKSYTLKALYAGEEPDAFSDERLYKDFEIAWYMVSINGLLIKNLSHNLKLEPKIISRALKNNGLALEFLPEDIRGGLSYVRSAIDQNPFAIRFATPKVLMDYYTGRHALSKSIDTFPLLHGKILRDKALCIKVLKLRGLFLEFVTESFKSDLDVVLAAVSQNGLAVKFADESLRKNRKVIKSAIEKNGLAIAYADDIFKIDPEICLLAVQRDGRALRFMSEGIQNIKRICRAAVAQNPNAIEYIGKDLLRDQQFLSEL